MTLHHLQPGDVVWANATLINDGSLPDLAEDAVLATPGTRGVLLNTGHLEEQPDTTIYLVRFEGPDGELGPPVGCWEAEIRTEA